MRTIELNHEELKALVRFTDPFLHSLEKEQEILSYFHAGRLRPPSLVEHGGRFLIFNGNHRVLVAIGNELTIACKILESLDDILLAQADEGDQFRDISSVSPLTFQGVVEELRHAAKRWGHQDPDSHSFADF